MLSIFRSVKGQEMPRLFSEGDTFLENIFSQFLKTHQIIPKAASFWFDA